MVFSRIDVFLGGFIPTICWEVEYSNNVLGSLYSNKNSYRLYTYVYIHMCVYIYIMYIYIYMYTYNTYLSIYIYIWFFALGSCPEIRDGPGIDV